MKVSVIVGTWKTLPHAKFCKNCLRGYTLWGKYILKITILGAVIFVTKTHIFKATVVKFAVTVQTWETLPPNQILYLKKSLKGVYQKLTISAILRAVSPHFKSDNGEIWREGTDLGHPLRLSRP